MTTKQDRETLEFLTKQSEEDAPRYVPTPDQIKAACLKIRKEKGEVPNPDPDFRYGSSVKYLHTDRDILDEVTAPRGYRPAIGEGDK